MHHDQHIAGKVVALILASSAVRAKYNWKNIQYGLHLPKLK